MSEFSTISLFDVLATPTVERNGGDFINAVANDAVTNDDDFSIQFHPEDIEQEDIVYEEPYTMEDANREAEKIVNIVDSLNTLILIPIGNSRVVKSYGGKKTVKGMQDAYFKKLNGKKLTDQDNEMIVAFENHKNSLTALAGKIPLTPSQRDIMVAMFAPMCMDRKLKINSNLSAIIAIIMIESQKIMAVINA